MTASRSAAVAFAAVVTLLALGAPAASADSGPITVEADPFTRQGANLAPGQLELATTSTRPSLVTGGDARVRVSGAASDDTVTISRDGVDVTSAFEPFGSALEGVVTDLVVGVNRVTASATGPTYGTREATLEILNHPIAGPVISGPHQVPFICQTERAGMGPPTDADCSAPTQVEWRYLTITDEFKPLADPYASYPSDLSVIDSRPFVVRIESTVINRSITRIAVLDDPHARGPNAPFEAAEWDHDVVYSFGESCGTGYHQGTNSVENVLGSLSAFSGSNLSGPLYDLPGRLRRGDAVVHSTLTILGVHCNQLLSAETAMTVLEYVGDRYGPVGNVVGSGASGGAIQQYTIANSYPGVLSAGTPTLSFPDVITTAMSAHDCALMIGVFGSDPDRWTSLKQIAVSGFASPQVCHDWNDEFAGHLKPRADCDGSIPDELLYDPVTNRGGARCTLQDNLVNLLGRDPATGFARRPVDNVGVQYGLAAANTGGISMSDFIQLNRNIGGFDIDGVPVPQRTSMEPDLAALVYRVGAVTGHAALSETPIIDVRINLDLVPVIGFHDQARPYELRARIDQLDGSHPGQQIWTGVPLPSDALTAASEWATVLQGRTAGERIATMAASRPPSAVDGCHVPGGIALGPASIVCDVAFAPKHSPRQVAGGPLTEDVIKCQLKPIDPRDYATAPTGSELTELQAIFPDGVCDWSKPGVGEEQPNMQWVSVGDGAVATTPFQVPYVVARSSTTPAPAALGGAGAAPTTTTPATGGSTPLLLVACLLLLAIAGRALRQAR
ncbi:MAG: DUF6351 family protein [Acidimicrobiales bacterium]